MFPTYNAYKIKKEESEKETYVNSSSQDRFVSRDIKNTVLFFLNIQISPIIYLAVQLIISLRT